MQRQASSSYCFAMAIPAVQGQAKTRCGSLFAALGIWHTKQQISLVFTALHRLKCFFQCKKSWMDGHLARVRHVFDKTRGRMSTQHQHRRPSQHNSSTDVHLNTTLAHTSNSAQHQHIRPSQHNISTSVHFNFHLSQPPCQSAAPLLAPEPRNPKPE